MRVMYSILIKLMTSVHLNYQSGYVLSGESIKEERIITNKRRKNNYSIQNELILDSGSVVQWARYLAVNQVMTVRIGPEPPLPSGGI